MKVKQAISEAGLMIPDHNVSAELLHIWLSRVEGEVFAIVRDDEREVVFSEGDGESVLSVPDPFSAIYPLYLQTMIYLYLGEYDRYNYLNSLYESARSEYAKYYLRTKK